MTRENTRPMPEKKDPESMGSQSHGHRKILRWISLILGFSYLAAGAGVAVYTGIRHSTRFSLPNESVTFFMYRNGTRLIPDPATNGIVGCLSLAALFFVVTTGFLILVLQGKYLDGFYVRHAWAEPDGFSRYTKSQLAGKTCRMIGISAWLACIMITGIFFIGFPFSEGIWCFYSVWILAVLQTFYVWWVRREYGIRE
jgi:hypothetical protein